MEHTHKGRTWTATGREPYTRADGTATELIRWCTQCAKCDRLVEIRTPLKYETTKAFGAKHCELHKMTQGEVRGLRRNAQENARRQKNAGK